MSTFGALQSKRQIRKPEKDTPVLDIYIDADACAVKEEIYRVAAALTSTAGVRRRQHRACLRVPAGDWVQAVLPPEGFGSVDDWIAEHAESRRHYRHALPTSRLAERGPAQGRRPCHPDPKGHAFTEDSIGEAGDGLRALMDELRPNGDGDRWTVADDQAGPLALPIAARRDDPCDPEEDRVRRSTTTY